MKVIVTGSLGHISKPLTQELAKKGHTITVISSNPEKQKDIEALGAAAAIGSLEDADFLVQTFTGADAAYTMLPPANFFDPNLDMIAYCNRLGNNYAQAIKTSGIKRVVNLSTIGAHLEKGSGILLGAHYMEKMLNELSSDVAVIHMRPVGFYYNLLGFINGIKTTGMIASNYGEGDMIPWVSPIDIAAAIAEEIVSPLSERKVRYVASDELTCNEVASILGTAIGKPGLEWKIIANEQLQTGLIAFGMNPQIVAGLAEMNASMHNGLLFEDYYSHKPVLGKVKMTDFARDFAVVFNKK